MSTESRTSIRSVPQTYRGVRFRSTLEADWAATLDSLGIAWEYEPEAVQLPSGEFYRPDFYLPECTTWLEVKGAHDERIDKVYEMGESVSHYPECDGHPRPPRLDLFALSDEAWDGIGQALAAAPNGPTQITVVRREWSPEEPQIGFRTIQSARVKRGILLDEKTRQLINRHDPLGVDNSCCMGWYDPWRMVVVGRPAQRGATQWESVQGLNLWLIKCSSCDKCSFVDNSGDSRCRQCGSCDDSYTAGRMWYVDFDEYPFARAPRGARGKETS